MPTKNVPPIIFPRVTGMRLLISIFDQVKFEKSVAVMPIFVQKDAGAPDLIISPTGIKYIFAMQCSKPAATKAVIGKITARILSVVLRALIAIHTAKQTNTLHRIPNTKASTKPMPVLVLAIFNAGKPTALPPKLYWPLTNKDIEALAI